MKAHIRQMLAIGGAVLLSAALAACGSSSSGSASSGSSSTTASGSAGSAGQKHLTIAYVAYDLADAPIQAYLSGLKLEAAQYGYTVTAVSANSDPSQANADMKIEALKGVSAITVDTFPASALATGIAAARAAHIPVYLQYAYPPAPTGVVWMNSPNLGPAETNAMLSDMHGTGSVLAWTLPSGAPCVLAANYLQAALKKYPAIHLTEHAIDPSDFAGDARTTTGAWLVSHPKGSGNLSIWGCFDGPNVGAVAALEAAGRTDVKVYGDDATSETIAQVLHKSETATWWFNTRQAGIDAVKQMHANASKADSQLTFVHQSQQPVEVNQSNAAAFVKQYPYAMTGSGA